MFTNITTNSANFNTHQLNHNANQLKSYTLYNPSNHIPTTPHPYTTYTTHPHITRTHPTYLPLPTPHTQKTLQTPPYSTTTMKYTTPYSTIPPQYTTQTQTRTQALPTPTTPHKYSYQIPQVNMNVTYKEGRPINTYNIHTHNHHHHLHHCTHNCRSGHKQKYVCIPPIPLTIPPIPPMPHIPLTLPSYNINTDRSQSIVPSEITSTSTGTDNSQKVTESIQNLNNANKSDLFTSYKMFGHIHTDLHQIVLRRKHVQNVPKSIAHKNKPRVSFPTGNRHKDRYIGLKRIGAGTFADIWEVYDQYDPKRKHWAIKVLKKSKCLNKQSKCIDSDKYVKYTNAMIAEGNRILRLNKQDMDHSSHIIECKEILKNLSKDTHTPQIHQHSYPNNIGPCVVLELMGISLLQYTQLYEKSKCLIPLISVRYIAIQLFNALSFLHGIGGYIHADLKPENVLITLSHSINGNLMGNKYPNIKIVDLGNALSYNRNINTFEVQSLYYRAPEVLFGNEMTSGIDLWSIGCILFELININEYNYSLYFDTAKKSDAKNTNTNTKRHRAHHALFACCNRQELAHKIENILSPYPHYVYNKYNSFYFNDLSPKRETQMSDYLQLKEYRKSQLLSRLNLSGSNLENINGEYLSFLDLISCLLDLNPCTRYTSEDAIQHSFCIDLKYICNDSKVRALLSTKFHSSYPLISISNDYDRQYRINAQIKQFQMFQNTVSPNSVQKPKEMAITRKRNAFSLQNHGNSHVIHNRIICLLHGCCNNPTLKNRRNQSKEYAIIPPLKKMKFTNHSNHYG